MRRRFFLRGTSIAALCVLAWIVLHAPFARFIGERALLVVHSSAARAYEYGERHFDSADPASYNLAYAEYFFRKAAALDGVYPLVHHQLARIHFLRGNFPAAIHEADEAIQLQGDQYPSTFYVRGLIEGYSGAYGAAAKDYAHFLSLQRKSWAGSNDYAWVLMKAHRYEDAVIALEQGLKYFPDNAWLLNSYAVALYESGQRAAAQEAAARAKEAVMKLAPADWSLANPGNDPSIASEGLATFQDAAVANLDIILTGQQGAL